MTNIRASAIDLVTINGRAFSTMTIQTLLHLDRQLDLTQLEQAIYLSLKAEPILGCQLVINPIRPFWRTQNPKHEKIPGLFQVIETEEPKQAIAELLPLGIDPSKDPLLQAYVIRDRRVHQDQLLLKFSHHIVDGPAMKTYATLLSQIYTSLKTDPNYTPPINREHRGIGHLLKRFTFSQKLEILRCLPPTLRKRFNLDNNWCFPNPEKRGQAGTYALMQIYPEQHRALSSYGRRYGATLNLVLVTAIYRALQANIPQSGSGALPLMISMDLRRYLAEEDRQAMPLTNFSTVTTLFVDLSSPQDQPLDFATTLIRVRDQMKVRKANYAGLVTVPLFLTLFNGLPFLLSQKLGFSKNAVAPAFTNAGIFDLPDCAFGEAQLTDVVALAAVQYAPAFAIAVTEFRKCLTFSTGFCQDLISHSTIDCIFQSIQAELAKVVELSAQRC